MTFCQRFVGSMNLFLNGVAADASHPLNSFKRHSLTSEGLDLSNLSGGGVSMMTGRLLKDVIINDFF